MSTRSIALTAAVLFVAQAMGPAAADNKMGYQLETKEQAAGLSPAGGSLGMRVGPEQEISSEGLTFELLKVENVGQGSPAAQAGLSVGDRIIAVNGHVFPSTATFAAVVGAVAPGKQIEVDYIPSDGGPDKAQRVGGTVGEKGQAAPAHTTAATADRKEGLSTGAKVAIGLGAATVFGCYELNCFSRLKKRYEEERAKYENRAAQPAPAQR